MFGLVELQRTGHCLQHRLRRPGQVTTFESGVIVHADPRQHRDLLPAQARDASPVTESGQTSPLRGQPGSATGEELLYVLAAIHILDATTHTPAETGPVSTRIGGSPALSRKALD
jgi:hypothetical protein